MAGKLRIAPATNHHRGPSTPRHKTLRHAIGLRGASLRMTVVEGVENIWLGVQKHGKIEKVTGSRDDGKGRAAVNIPINKKRKNEKKY